MLNFGAKTRSCRNSMLQMNLQAAGKSRMVSEKILINAQTSFVFEAIRKLRVEKGRQLESYDGKVAVIKEELEGVPVYGKVECVWQETEIPYERIDFKMLSSTKFKESYGAYILKANNGGTSLELQVHMDAGIMIPFAAELTKASTSKDSKVRLEKIKQIAEKLSREQAQTEQG